MFRLKCPQCGSLRIKKGYRETPFVWKLYGKHRLHCSSCNWEFEAIVLFARLPTRKERHRLKEEEKLARWHAKRQKMDLQIDDLLQQQRIGKREERIKDRFSYGSEFDESLLNKSDFNENQDVKGDNLLEIDFAREKMPIKLQKPVRYKIGR